MSMGEEEEEEKRGRGGEEEERVRGESKKSGKSCKGCLYYSSLRKSQGRSPLCVGVSRTLHQVPGYIGESEMEASKEGRTLTDFKYACVGYSVHLNNKDSSTDPKEKEAELPFCVGIELLVDKRATTADHAPARARNREDDHVFTQPRQYKPPHSIGEEFFSRFTRNAGLVAGGVVRNLNRVGNYIKDNLDDILYPYRRRPK